MRHFLLCCFIVFTLSACSSVAIPRIQADEVVFNYWRINEKANIDIKIRGMATSDESVLMQLLQ